MGLVQPWPLGPDLVHRCSGRPSYIHWTLVILRPPCVVGTRNDLARGAEGSRHCFPRHLAGGGVRGSRRKTPACRLDALPLLPLGPGTSLIATLPSPVGPLPPFALLRQPEPSPTPPTPLLAARPWPRSLRSKDAVPLWGTPRCSDHPPLFLPLVTLKQLLVAPPGTRQVDVHVLQGPPAGPSTRSRFPFSPHPPRVLSSLFLPRVLPHLFPPSAFSVLCPVPHILHLFLAPTTLLPVPNLCSPPALPVLYPFALRTSRSAHLPVLHTCHLRDQTRQSSPP